MNFIKTPVKGMRDILPKEMEIRDYVINQITETYKLFGFNKIETPCVEHIENISSNQGGENEKLTFKILKRGEKLKINEINTEMDLVDSGLRYDLTVPLSRYYANNMNELDKPFKALQIGNVWRADRPQKGRYRQFVQCDIDIFGEKNNIAEIELIEATTTLLNKIGLNDYKVKINDRRILKLMASKAGFQEKDFNSVFIILDKMDKIGKDGVREELEKSGFDKKIVNNYISFFELDYKNVSEFFSKSGLSDTDVSSNIDDVIDIVKNVNNINIEFDPTLVRGMSYYTGIIFEIEVANYPGSIAGGGRYDEMIEKYANISVPACGFSIGFERLINILMENNYKILNTNKKYAIIINKECTKEELMQNLKKADEIRNSGNIVNVLFKNKNYKHQLEVLEENDYEVIDYKN